MLSVYEDRRKSITTIQNDGVANVASVPNCPVPTSNPQSLLKYGLWLGVSYSLCVSSNSHNNKEDCEGRIQTLTDADFRRVSYFTFPSFITMSSHCRAQGATVRNESSFVFRVKAYCPTCFAYYREQCGIPSQRVLAFLDAYWLGGDVALHPFEVVSLTVREKARVVELLKSFIAVGAVFVVEGSTDASTGRATSRGSAACFEWWCLPRASRGTAV